MNEETRDKTGGQDINKEALLQTLPLAVQSPSLLAHGAGTAEILARRVAENDQLRIYSRIDELPEELLDILAKDLKVDWWDPDYSLEEKRRTLKSSWMVHKRLGTRWAVETAISAIYPDSRVECWYEYGGRPYHFRFQINTSGRVSTAEEQAKVLKLARFYRSLRDHLEKLIYTVETDPVVLHTGCAFGTVVKMPAVVAQ